MDIGKNQHRLNLIVSSATARIPDPNSGTFQGKERNLFRHSSLQRLKYPYFQQSKPYQYVGVKELKTFYQRAHKLNRDSKRITISNIANNSSNWSFTSRQGSSGAFLTKNQVFQLKKKEKQQLKNERSSKDEKQLRLTFNQSLVSSQSRLNLSFEKKGYSMQRIKQTYRKYEHNWLQIYQKCQKQKGFPSLLISVANQRQKQLSKQNSELNFQKTRINSRMWEHTLRSQHNLSSIYNKKAGNDMKLAKKPFGLSGKNKLNKETVWIGSKDNQGYRFKPILKM